MTASRSFLRRVLILDAVMSGAAAALLIAGAEFLSNFLGLPSVLLRTAGLILVPFVALVAWTAAHSGGAALVWAIIIANAAWVAASAAVLVGGWFAPTALGYGFVIVQALAVGAFAELQFLGLRKAAAA